jgi:hypothetical protein
LKLNLVTINFHTGSPFPFSVELLLLAEELELRLLCDALELFSSPAAGNSKAEFV